MTDFLNQSQYQRPYQVKFVKGQSGNPGAKTAAQQRLAKMLYGLTPKAIKTLDELLDCPEQAVRLGAAREVLARSVPVPKQSLAQIAAAAAGGAAAGHLTALREIAERRIAAPGDQAKLIEGHVEEVSTPCNRVLKDEE